MNSIKEGELNQLLHDGVAIPAHPTALNRDLSIDERRQRALTRYYLDAGVGGLAIGVHTSQFEIREQGLYRPVLALGKEEIDRFESKNDRNIIRIAGVIGRTEQAVEEARIASELDYHAVLLSLAAYRGEQNEDIIAHCKAVAEVIPVIGFYLQEACGGRTLDTDFWRQFAQIENVVAIKMAPFNRYQTYEVVRGVAESGRAEKIALYTGNDDNIVVDLLSSYEVPLGNQVIKKRIVGGLLGHWSAWTKPAVELLSRIKGADASEYPELLVLANKITDANQAFFDARNGFGGSIAGMHEVLKRQGLLEETITISPKEVLGPGQKEEIDRVYKCYPELNDDAFVRANLDKWLN